MKLLTVIASTLLFALISQQSTSALPVDEKMFDVTTELPHVDHVERNLVDLTTEMPLAQAKRDTDEPSEEWKTETIQQQPQQQQQQQVQQEVRKPHVEQTEQHTDEDTDDDQKKRGVTEEHVEEKPKKFEEHVEEEKPKKFEEHVEEEKPKKVEEHVEEEKPKKVEEEKHKSSDFCPENYVKFEDSCLFVGTKAKIAARSGKVSTSKIDSALVENFPVGEDNSCPPGTEYTERGVCQKILADAEMKAKKIAHSCPQNAEFVNGQCVFHSLDMMHSTMEMPLETSERPEIHHEKEIATATESKSMIESEFETTMESVLKP